MLRGFPPRLAGPAGSEPCGSRTTRGPHTLCRRPALVPQTLVSGPQPGLWASALSTQNLSDVPATAPVTGNAVYPWGTLPAPGKVDQVAQPVSRLFASVQFFKLHPIRAAPSAHPSALLGDCPLPQVPSQVCLHHLSCVLPSFSHSLRQGGAAPKRTAEALGARTRPGAPTSALVCCAPRCHPREASVSHTRI